MKWYNIKKYRPNHTGDLHIIRLKNGYIHGAIFDHQKDVGYFFENDDARRFTLDEISHFSIPDPIDIND